jgi:hypothetical protein
MKIIIGIIAFYSLITIIGCGTSSDSYLNTHQDFHFILRYGVEAKNEINTINQTYTKDMIVDSALTIRMTLSSIELDSIWKELTRIDIFSYPDIYQPLRFENDPGNVGEDYLPYKSFYLYITAGDHKKEIHWGDANRSTMLKAIALRNAFEMIILMIESKDEVKKLPAPKGAYL